jgi:hypothetical protein
MIDQLTRSTAIETTAVLIPTAPLREEKPLTEREILDLRVEMLKDRLRRIEEQETIAKNKIRKFFRRK